MEDLAQHVGTLVWLIGGLLTIVGWFIINKINKNDATINKIFDIVEDNRDKFDAIIESMRVKVEDDIRSLRKQTNELELNYNKKFGDVRQDISNLKENTIEQHGELKLILTELKGKVQVKGGNN